MYRKVEIMKILLSPQVRDFNKIWYEITENKITATINGISDTFDFTGMPNGKLQPSDSDGKSMIETTLGEVPILDAEKTDGVLTVEILFSIDINEKDERLLFPKPMELDEFNDLMNELAEREKGEEDDSGDNIEADSDGSLEENGNIDIEEIDF